MAIKEEYIEIRKIRFRYIHRAGSKDATPVFFLHGFTGSAGDWIDVMKNLPEEIPAFALDLIGHGKTDAPDSPEFYSTGRQIDYIDAFIDDIIADSPIVVGYSMGGRLALQYSVNKPEKLKGVVLESAAAGIEDRNERFKRILSDAKLIEQLQTKGVNKFINYWMSLPLFGSLKNIEPEKYREIIEMKKSNSAVGLINSLKGFGAGVMPDIWNKLHTLDFPVLIITGEKDEKYVSIGKKLKGILKNSEMVVVPYAGHNTHLEKASDFINFVVQFCNKISKE